MTTWRKSTNKTNLYAPKFYIRDLVSSDADQLKNWGENEDILLRSYNYAQLTSKELHYWVKYKRHSMSKRYFSIVDYEGRFLGYIGMKNINPLSRSSMLGFVMDPNYSNQGIGSESLSLFLDYYFSELQMKTMYLEVNEFNKRALRVYEKMGFTQAWEHIEEFEDQDYDEETKRKIDDNESMFLIKGKIYTKIYTMRLDSYRYERGGRQNEIYHR